MINASHLPLAIGASLALHGAAITALEALPGALHAPQVRSAEPAALRATLSAPASAAGQTAAPTVTAKRQRGVENEPTFGIGPMYYPADLLDERPQVRTHIEPRFPDSAEGVAGRVVLHLYINEDGTVDEVAIVQSDPPGLFEAAAAEAFGPARFRPGRKAGITVKSRLAIEVLFGTPLSTSQSAAVNGGRNE